MLTYRISPRARADLHSSNISIFKPNPEYIIKQSGFRAWNRILSLPYFEKRLGDLEVIFLSYQEMKERSPKSAGLLAFSAFPDGPVYIFTNNVLDRMNKCSLDPYLQLVYLISHELVHANDYLGPLGKLRAGLQERYRKTLNKHVGIKELMDLHSLRDFMRTFEEGRAIRIEQALASENTDPLGHKTWFELHNGERPCFKGINDLDYAEFIRRLQILEPVKIWDQLEPTKEEILHPERFEARISKLYDNVRNSELFLDNVLLFPLSRTFYLDEMMS